MISEAGLLAAERREGVAVSVGHRNPRFKTLHRCFEPERPVRAAYRTTERGIPFRARVCKGVGFGP